MDTHLLLLTIVLIFTCRGQGDDSNKEKIFVCPPPTEIDPCTCTQGLTFACVGPMVTQERIDKVFTAIRQTNNISGDGQLKIKDMEIRMTNLTTFDLTPLLGCHFVDRLGIFQNQRLTTFVGPEKNLKNGNEPSPPSKQILVSNVELDINALDNEGVAQFLAYVKSDDLTNLFLKDNFIRGTPTTTPASVTWELIPGLTAFKNLEKLDVSYNKIHYLAGGPFQKLTKLKRLRLKNNRLSRVGPHGFDFSGSVADDLLEICADSNDLTDEGLDPHSGLETIPVPTEIYLRGNKFQSISVEKFGVYLRDSRNINIINLKENPLVCDKKLDWIRQLVNGETRVFGISCPVTTHKNVFDLDDADNEL